MSTTEFTYTEILEEIRRRLAEDYRGPDADHAAAAEMALITTMQDANGAHIFQGQMLTHAILALVYELRKAQPR